MCLNEDCTLQGFEHHVKEEHCMWDYIYFYIHLERIDINDHNAIESYVYQQVVHEFLPVVCIYCTYIHYIIDQW